MAQPDVLDQDIRAMQDWLRDAWQLLADPSLTTYGRRELRNQMKQCNADLRIQLQRAAERQQDESVAAERSFTRPELRILGWS